MAVLALALYVLTSTGCKKDNLSAQSPDANLDDQELNSLNSHLPGCQLDSSTYGLVTTIAGNGTMGDVNGTGKNARIFGPASLVPDIFGNLYFQGNYRVKKMTPAAVVSTYAGTGVEGTTNCFRTSATFGYTASIAIGPDGSLYVTQPNEKLIRKISPLGLVSTLAGTGAAGFVDGPRSVATFYTPGAMVVDAYSNVYVVENTNYIRKISPTGKVSTFAGNIAGIGFVDGKDTSARFVNINALTIDAAGNIYASDGLTQTEIRKISPKGVVTTFIPYGEYTFGAIAFDSHHNLYASNINSLVKITPKGAITTLAGSTDVTVTGSADGKGAAATFNYIQSLTVDRSDNLYVGDNNLIRKVGIKLPCKPKVFANNGHHHS